MLVTVVRRESRDAVAIELQVEVTLSVRGTLLPFSNAIKRLLY